MNVLISSAGRRVSLVRAFMEQAKAEGKNRKIYASDMRTDMSAACQIADGALTVFPLTHPEFISNLIEQCNKHTIQLIVPTLDTELRLLSKHLDEFNKNQIQVVISSAEFIDICRDKRKTNSFFTSKNIQIPLPIDPKNPTFPLFIKPFDGSLSSDIHLIEKQEDLSQRFIENPRFMFMEYIDKKLFDEFTVDMYYGKDSMVKCIVPRKRIEIRGGEISKGITLKNEIITYLKERLNIIEGAHGCLTLQLFKEKEGDRIIGIEINPRFGGGFPLSYLAGANYPGFILKEYFENETITYSDNWKANTLMLRYDHEVIIHDYQQS